MVNQGGLLPFNEELALSGERTLNLVRVVSDRGATAVVYEGTLHDPGANLESKDIRVAVKGFRPAMGQEKAVKETGVLERLMKLELEFYAQFDQQGMKIAPIIYGRSAYENIDYIVMEFIEGKEIISCSNSNEIGTKEKIYAIWQFLAFLDVVHTGFGSCLVDMKFENLIWTTKGLRVLDVADIVPESKKLDTKSYFRTQKYDLLRTAILLFRLLTGYGLKYSSNGLAEDIEPQLAKDELDWGMKQFLRSCLGWKVDQRIETAREMCDLLKQELECWEMTDQALLKDALKNLDSIQEQEATSKEAQIESKRSSIVRALTALSVIHARNPEGTGISDFDEEVGNALQKAEGLYDENNYLHIGRDWLENGIYDSAMKQFEKGIGLGKEPTTLRRWIYAAQCGMELNYDANLFKPVFDDLDKIINLLLKESFNEVQGILDDFDQKGKTTKGYQNLVADFRLWHACKVAKISMADGRYDDAIKNYQNALSTLQTLPDSESIQTRELENLKEKVDLARHYKNTVGDALIQLRGVMIPTRVEELDPIFRTCQDAINLAPEIKEVHEEICLLVDGCIKKGFFAEAAKLADMGVVGLHPDQTLLVRQQLALHLAHASDLLVGLHIVDLIAEMKWIHNQFKSDELGSISKHAILQLVDKAIDILSEMGLKFQLSALGELILQVEGEGSQRDIKIKEKSNEISDELKKFIDEMLNRAKIFMRTSGQMWEQKVIDSLSLMENRETLTRGFETGEEIRIGLEDACQISESIDYENDELKNALDLVNEFLQSKDKHQENQSYLEQEKLEQLALEWADLQTNLQWIGQQPAFLLSTSEMGQLKNKVAMRALALLAAAQGYKNKKFADGTPVQKVIEQIQVQLEPYGKPIWEAIRQIAEQKLGEHEEKIKQIKTEFNNGELDLVAVSADQWHIFDSDDPELRKLKERILAAMEFDAYQEYDSSINSDTFEETTLETLASFEEKILPHPFWQNKQAVAYLKRLDKKCRDQLQESKNSTSPADDMYTIIRNWILVKSILNRVPKG